MLQTIMGLPLYFVFMLFERRIAEIVTCIIWQLSDSTITIFAHSNQNHCYKDENISIFKGVTREQDHFDNIISFIGTINQNESSVC